MNPWVSLFGSRKFLLLLLDTAIALVVYFVGKYTGASIAEDVGLVILLMQPVFVAVILGIAIEDAAFKRAGGRYES